MPRGRRLRHFPSDLADSRVSADELEQDDRSQPSVLLPAAASPVSQGEDSSRRGCERRTQPRTGNEQFQSRRCPEGRQVTTGGMAPCPLPDRWKDEGLHVDSREEKALRDVFPGESTSVGWPVKGHQATDEIEGESCCSHPFRRSVTAPGAQTHSQRGQGSGTEHRDRHFRIGDTQLGFQGIQRPRFQ